MAPSQASNLVFSAVALLASLLLIIQLPIHFEPTKSSNWLFLVWMILLLLNSSINAIIWNDNMVNWAPVWCDISSNIILASNFGVQLSLLCISRRLYGAVTGKIPSDDEERRSMLLDIFVAISVPLLWLPLDYVLEASEYLLAEQEGCYPAIPRTIPTILLSIMWPVIFAFVTAAYSALTMYIIRRRRARLREFTFEDVGDVVDNYQWRLTLLASAQIVLILPSRIYDLASNLAATFNPYNWNAIHADFSHVYQIPIGDWAYDAKSLVAFELFGRWMYISYAFLFVAFFGWTKRARSHYNRHYGRAFFATIRLLGYHDQSSSDTREARRDLEHASPAHGLVFRSFLTSGATTFGASRFTSTQATETYHSAREQIVSRPEVPAPTHEHDPKSPQLPCVEAAVPLTHTDAKPTSPVSKPKPAFLGHNHP